MKRRLTKLVFFLVLGTIVNVAVAWGCVWRGYHKNSTAHRPTEDDIRWWYAHVPEDFPISPWEVDETHDFGVNGTMMFEGWDSPNFSNSMRIRAGLPMRALEGSIWADDSKGQVPKIEWQLMIVLNDQRILPLYPLFPGFTINTIFYAVILWLPFAPFQLRRYMRVKRGLCLKCGYDLRGISGGEVCPECGTQATKHPESS